METVYKKETKYNINVTEGYDLFLNNINTEKYTTIIYGNHFFLVKKTEDGSFHIKKKIKNKGTAEIIGSDLFNALNKLIEHYQLI
jgi:predicted amino acid racemase